MYPRKSAVPYRGLPTFYYFYALFNPRCMAKKKKKKQGHFCKVCHEYKANEKFSGKGHALHICKQCMSALKHGAATDEAGVSPDEDFTDCVYIPDDGEACDHMPDDCLPIILERKNFKKLDRDEKLAVKEFIADIVAEYWNEKRQIPAGESLAVIKKTLIRVYQETYYVMLKDDTELKTYLRDHTIAVINRLLREERQEKEEGAASAIPKKK